MGKIRFKELEGTMHYGENWAAAQAGGKMFAFWIRRDESASGKKRWFLMEGRRETAEGSRKKMEKKMTNMFNGVLDEIESGILKDWLSMSFNFDIKGRERLNVGEDIIEIDKVGLEIMAAVNGKTAGIARGLNNIEKALLHGVARARLQRHEAFIANGEILAL